MHRLTRTEVARKRENRKVRRMPPALPQGESAVSNPPGDRWDKGRRVRRGKQAFSEKEF